MKDKYAINRAIKEYIEENDKKSGAIADKAGIRRDVFSRIVCSRRPIYADELVPILNALGISIEYLIEKANIA